jgi:hypothetical protein
MRLCSYGSRAVSSEARWSERCRNPGWPLDDDEIAQQDLPGDTFVVRVTMPAQQAPA